MITRDAIYIDGKWVPAGRMEKLRSSTRQMNKSSALFRLVRKEMSMLPFRQQSISFVVEVQYRREAGVPERNLICNR